MRREQGQIFVIFLVVGAVIAAIAAIVVGNTSSVEQKSGFTGKYIWSSSSVTVDKYSQRITLLDGDIFFVRVEAELTDGTFVKSDQKLIHVSIDRGASSVYITFLSPENPGEILFQQHLALSEVLTVPLVFEDLCGNEGCSIPLLKLIRIKEETTRQIIFEVFP